MPVLGKNAS